MRHGPQFRTCSSSRCTTSRNYLDLYNTQHGGPALHALPYNSQFKCYDGMHNWNQLQPAPYDGMYKFPSVTATDADDRQADRYQLHDLHAESPQCATDAILYYGLPMLPAGKYVVEVVLPPGFELVKEEDKNILIGDNFIAPVTQQFGGLGNVFIMPDQASVATQAMPAAGYNANNAQNPTQSLGTRRRTTASCRDSCPSRPGRASAKRASCPTTSACFRSRSR